MMLLLPAPAPILLLAPPKRIGIGSRVVWSESGREQMVHHWFRNWRWTIDLTFTVQKIQWPELGRRASCKVEELPFWMELHNFKLARTG